MRPPLGAIHAGSCALLSTTCPEELVEEECNFGYAAECPTLPEQREADAHRFVVARLDGEQVLVRWSVEREHRPISVGEARWDRVNGWVDAPPDALGRQLRIFVENYWEMMEDVRG